MEQALAPDAPKVHEFGNVLRHVHIVHGDPDRAEADVWVEGYYETAMQDQAPLGPEAGLAIPADDGGVDLLRRDPVAARRPRADRAVPRPARRTRFVCTSPASAAPSARARTSTCRSTPACSRSAPAGP